MSRFWWNVLSVWIGVIWITPAFAAEELKQLLGHLLAVPTIQTASGFTAKVLVPPGSFYDPFDLYSRGPMLWVSDDGKEEGEKGGQIFTVYCPLPEKGEDRMKVERISKKLNAIANCFNGSPVAHLRDVPRARRNLQSQ